ncbi:hypothetical protein Acr_28g0002120 [Actinidia rufa]|uniref:Uncharacterized protein n=1 Tax=Actinidia rufa TaxID=165716 RepID=A0A7J0H8T0_9ERIC|nr:hypothetical protein Acr_28g0002120 [Actinidia rufa]
MRERSGRRRIEDWAFRIGAMNNDETMDNVEVQRTRTGGGRQNDVTIVFSGGHHKQSSSPEATTIAVSPTIGARVARVRWILQALVQFTGCSDWIEAQSVAILWIPIFVAFLKRGGVGVVVVVEIWASNQQSILLGFLGTGSRKIKGRPAQTNKNKGPGRGRSKPLRRGDQTKAMTADGVMGRVHGSRRDPRKDEYGKISRRYRRHNWKERILVEMESLEMEILSTLPRPRARRRQYFGSGRSDEYSEGGSGELNGDDDLASSHGLVLPRSRGFGDKVWRSKCGDGTS